MATKSKERLIRILLIIYMVAVSLFGYVVLNTPPDSEAQCKTVNFCAQGSGGSCCPGGQSTGPVLTGIQFSGTNYYSDICIQP